MMKSETMMLTIALTLTIELVAGLLVIPAIELQKQAEARGCPVSTPAANASKTRCFHP